MTRYTPPLCNYKKSPVANIITSRSCPHLCTFCDNNSFGRKVRYRSPENIAAEIEYLMNHHGVKEIAFVDDTFTLPHHDSCFRPGPTVNKDKIDKTLI
jgi:radical SAM superfamily enzyme YgiQ (UPF0313 family)